MYLFVYGTLKRNCVNHSLLKNSKYVCEAIIKGTLIDLGVGFPAYLEDGDYNVFGEIYEIDNNLLDFLDKFEGFYPNNLKDSLYIRKTINISLNEDKIINCEIYIMPKENLNKFNYKIIPPGKW